MAAACHHTFPASSEKPAATARHRRARHVEEAQKLGFWWYSSRQIAQFLQVPDSSFRHDWQQYQRRCQESQFPRPFAEFCQSLTGQKFLLQQLAALHLVFGQSNDCGLRNLCWFLRLSGLDEFLPASYGAQQAFAAELETLLAQFGEEEEARLAAQMPAREISICEDETFHPQICLVAIEPVSDYLLLEQYAQARDAETWNRCLDERLQDWSVTVCQVTSDEASALIAHALEHLGAHHSPDLFHVQQETVRAVSFGLAQQTRRAHEAVAKAQRQVDLCQEERSACREQCPEGAAAVERQCDEAVALADRAHQQLATCQQRQQRAIEARRGVSHDYHPVDLGSGQPVTAEEVGRRLDERFDQLDAVAREAALSVPAHRRLAKARRVLPAMQSTILFFWTHVAAQIASWQLSQPVAAWLREQLIPGIYLEMASAKLPTAKQRRALQARAQEILARARSPDGVWGTLSETQRAALESKARNCAALFQRSSSCVEGHNGQLSLRHHGLHRLTGRKLAALGVLHNYLVERRDGTTAAERFFGDRPQPLFPWLLTRLALPDYPRRQRRAT
jgi:hypothetical protein